MDFGDLLILLLFFLFPILSRLFGKKEPPAPQRKRRPVPRPDGSARPQVAHPEDPLGEALRQIREALGEPEPEVSTGETLSETSSDFHNLGAYEHDEHGFGRSNPLSEEVFEDHPVFREQRIAAKQGKTDRIKQKPLKSVDLTTPIEVKDVGRTTARTSPADVLRDPRRAREAFIMKEVLGPPRSKRPLR